ncbi:hypothetical protein DL95DRAFT_468201 [Leptodontidium sp. 2 PMI_412]|nr:hypothetical protein DL95DRAFT_468201 [Leptodontidium sp. 2 PMI_412]
MRGKIERVIVVGAGPVGLLTALFLGQRSIVVDVVEASDKVNDSPRGLAVLSRAGILNKVIERGYVPADVSWRRPNGEFIVGFQVPKITLAGLPSIVMLPVGSLSPLLVEEIQKLDNVTLNWNHRVEVEGQGSKVTKRMTAHFVIGCDGGSSAVRKSIFGSNFPGWTWHKQLVAVNAYMNFDGLNLSDIQWVVDPENWYVIGRINKKGLWRLVYGETLGLSVQEIKDRLPERLRRTLPGNPEPGQYQIANVTPGDATMSAAQQQVDQSLGCDLTRFYDKPIAFGQE